MEIHDKVNHLQRQVPPNFGNRELLTVDNLYTGAFVLRDWLIHLGVVFYCCKLVIGEPRTGIASRTSRDESNDVPRRCLKSSMALLSFIPR